MQLAKLTTACARCNDGGAVIVHYAYVKDGAVIADPWPWGFECYVCRADWPAREQDIEDLPEHFKGRPK